MAGLAPAPGEKPWNLDAFGQPKNEDPWDGHTHYVQVVDQRHGPEHTLIRLRALINVLESRIQDIPEGKEFDPRSLTLSTHTINGQTTHRATYTTKEQP